MELLDALKIALNEGRGITYAKTVHLAFSNDGLESAWLSELSIEELLPRVEEWCKHQRDVMNSVVH